MPTLAIDDLTVDVVGLPTWSEGGHHQGRLLAPFIEAMVRVLPSVPTIKLDRSNAHIVLTLDTGGRVEGHGMWLVGGLRTNGDVAMVRFEGVSVVAS
jgi:hypothetical protein